jgi:hypothetical protein
MRSGKRRLARPALADLPVVPSVREPIGSGLTFVAMMIV